MSSGAAELIVILGALAIVIAVAVRKVPQRKTLAFIGGSLIVGGTLFGGLAWAGVSGIWNFEPGPDPTADPLFTVVFLSTSDTDRTELSETITPDGHTITYALTDENMDGLGDVNLDVRVANVNVGSSDDTWRFTAEIVMVTQVAQNGAIVNLTSYNQLWSVDWTLSDIGSPTLSSLEGDKAVSTDWKTGMADQLNIDLYMSPTNCGSLTDDLPGLVDFKVGGIDLHLKLTESYA